MPNALSDRMDANTAATEPTYPVITIIEEVPTVNGVGYPTWDDALVAQLAAVEFYNFETFGQEVR